MPRMIDLVRNSQLPSYLMHSAVRGALRVQPDEMIEILVHLATHNKVFGEQARMTLAGWDEHASKAVAANPKTSPEILNYYISAKNLRPAILPCLLENPSVKNQQIIDLAEKAPRETIEIMLASERVKSSPTLLQSLRENPALRPNEAAELDRRLGPLGKGAVGGVVAAHAQGVAGYSSAPGPVMGVEVAEPDDPQVTQALDQFLKENEQELAQEGDKPFEPVRSGFDDTEAEHAQVEAVGAPVEEPTKPAAATAVASSGAAAAVARAKKHVPEKEANRESTLQKIARLDIKGRIALAMRGTKEDRSILIRDGTKLVALAVLDSPKISDGEVEKIALQKNVLESVLRAIPLKRRFAKNYAIMRNLVYNPRTPLDLSLGIMKNLLIHDLKNLSGNKEVPETIRKLALRMFKQKTEKKRE